MSEQIRSIFIGTLGLTAAASVAGVLTVVRGGIIAKETLIRVTFRTALLSILCQAVHFGEETWTGFPERFPKLLGLAPWPYSFFIAFNVVWLLIWVIAARGMTSRHPITLFPLWFLGIAGVANGLAHPVLSLYVGGYFPGLVTSPLVGVAGVLLLSRLNRVTQRRRFV